MLNIISHSQGDIALSSHKSQGTYKEGGVIGSLNLALVPDCGDRCTEVHGKTHSNQTYLHCMSSDEEMPPENEITHVREKVNTFIFLINTWLILLFFWERLLFAGYLFTI